MRKIVEHEYGVINGKMVDCRMGIENKKLEKRMLGKKGDKE